MWSEATCTAAHPSTRVQLACEQALGLAYTAAALSCYLLVRWQQRRLLLDAEEASNKLIGVGHLERTLELRARLRSASGEDSRTGEAIAPRAAGS
jgi:hypothetical protein